mmetsp:Transcript_13418/g.58663  ORF Transcript_13418/g.58663 Transcript_13418/m.58663 type:complete len:263 (+) Transcript_13418:3508-4296(+)
MTISASGNQNESNAAVTPRPLHASNITTFPGVTTVSGVADFAPIVGSSRESSSRTRSYVPYASVTSFGAFLCENSRRVRGSANTTSKKGSRVKRERYGDSADFRRNRVRIRSIARSRLSGVSSERVSSDGSPFFSPDGRDVAAARPSSSLALNLAAPAPVTDHSGGFACATLALYHSNSVARTFSSVGCAFVHPAPHRHALRPRRTALPTFTCPNASRIRPLQTVVTSPRSWHRPHGVAAVGIDPGTFGSSPSRRATHARPK